MCTATHGHEVALLVAQGYETIGFKKSVLRNIPKGLRDEAKDYVNIVPDAYRWLPDGFVEVVEVENTHLLREDRLRKYTQLWFDLDCDDIGLLLKVIVVGRPEVEVDLCSEFYRFLKNDLVGKE